VRRASASLVARLAVWRAFQVRAAPSTGTSIPAGQSKRRHADGHRETAVVPISQEQQRKDVLAIRAADPNLAIEPHQGVDASTAARRAGA
jgi:hypothetical protein